MRLVEKILFVVVFVGAALLSGFAYYLFTYEFLLPLGRSITFFVSCGAMLITFVLGGLFEDRCLWHGIFEPSRGELPPLRNNELFRAAPPPITMGTMIGIASFLVWS